MNHQDEFINTFKHTAIGKSRTQIFDDFLSISVASLDRDEETFSQIVANYEPKTVHAFGEMLGELAAALNDCIAQHILVDHALNLELKIPTDSSHKPRYRDVLGEIFHRLEFNDRDGGQVFTPQSAADIMGATTLSEEFARQAIKTYGFVLIEERCCGSGALIFGALNALLEFGINPCRFARVFASDVDERCLKMCFLQLALYGIPATVQKKDAVTDQVLGKSFITPILKHGRLRNENH